LIRLAGLDIRPCNACMVCREEERCPIDDDLMPLYAKLKAFMERVGFIALPGRNFAGKVGGPLVAARRAGQNFTFAELRFWFHIEDIITPGSTYWNVAFGRGKGEVTDDEEGMNTAWNFGKNVAALVKKLKA